MIFGKKKETDLEEIKKPTELLDLRAISLDVKVTLEGVTVECKTNKIAKRAIVDIYGVSEDDFNAATDIMVNAGKEVSAVLRKYGDEVIDEGKTKDKN